MKNEDSYLELKKIVKIYALSGVNYKFPRTTIISPDLASCLSARGVGGGGKNSS